jgi:cyclopropane fatty-acyl-phospholipid synthase-like methyltransferase
MTWRQRLGKAVVSQFHRPHGVAGRLVGWEATLRPSNRRRNQWAVSLLHIEATDHFLEIGIGPGLALREAAQLALQGNIVGVDHSAEMATSDETQPGRSAHPTGQALSGSRGGSS